MPVKSNSHYLHGTKNLQHTSVIKLKKGNTANRRKMKGTRFALEWTLIKILTL